MGALSDIRLSGGICGGEELSPPGKEGAAETHALVLRLTPQCNRGAVGPDHGRAWHTLPSVAGDPGWGPLGGAPGSQTPPFPAKPKQEFRSPLLPSPLSARMESWRARTPAHSGRAFTPRPTPHHSTCPEFPVPEPLIEKEGATQVKNSQLKATTWGRV